MKKTFLILAAVAALAAPLGAVTTVLFPLQQITGSSVNRAITIIPDIPAQGTPINGTNLLALTVIQVQPRNGVGAASLVPWSYTARIDGWPRSIHFPVADSPTPVSVVNLITNGVAFYPAGFAVPWSFLPTNNSVASVPTGSYLASGCAVAELNGNWFSNSVQQIAQYTYVIYTNAAANADGWLLWRALAGDPPWAFKLNGVQQYIGDIGSLISINGAPSPVPNLSANYTLPYSPALNFGGHFFGSFSGDVSSASNANAGTLFGSGTVPVQFLLGSDVLAVFMTNSGSINPGAGGVGDVQASQIYPGYDLPVTPYAVAIVDAANGFQAPMPLAIFTTNNASQLTSGTLPVARAPGITTNLQFSLGTARTNTLYFTNGVLMRVTQP